MIPIILKRRPFLVRLVRSYKAFRPMMSRREALRGAFLLSTCGTNLDVIARGVGLTAGALVAAWRAGAGLLRLAGRAFSADTAGLFWAGVSFSTALDYLLRGEVLPFVAWLVWAGVVLGLARRVMRIGQDKRDRMMFDRGVVTGRDMERARAADTPANVGARIGRLVADQVNDILKKG